MVTMKSLPEGYSAIVFGSTGGIGSAVVKLLEADPRCKNIKRFSRSTNPAIDLLDEDLISRAASSIDHDVHLLFDATGFLSDEAISPEKSLKDLNAENMIKLMELNAIGPSILLKHFASHMPRNERSIFATLSARVGSIGDNALGGWYGYRASKAALNMLVKCASIEIRRGRPHSVVVALHPGTVATGLSEPFSRGKSRMDRLTSAGMLLNVIDGLPASGTGSFVDYNGESIPW